MRAPPASFGLYSLGRSSISNWITDQGSSELTQVENPLHTHLLIRKASALTLEQAIGQLLCPLLKGSDYDQLMRWQESNHFGSVFFNSQTHEQFLTASRVINSVAVSPVVVAADLEHGAVAVSDKSTPFPWAMAVAAADDEQLAYEMGRATAIEGRSAGIHWTFAPDIDINFNFRAPESNIRTYGDDPARIERMAVAYIRGVQENNLVAATAKHFPGTGIDERDQHLVTAVNPLTVDLWMATFGRVWKAAIEADVMSVMPGHISFPAWQNEAPVDAMPATLCPKLMIDLLREELGFEGVIVSDAAPMIGMTSRVPENDAIVEFVKAGGDSYLFARPEIDFKRLLTGVHDGELSEERIYQSAQRMLDMKVKLGMDQNTSIDEPTAEQREQFETSARTIAERSLTVIKDNGKVGQAPQPGAKVLTVTIDFNNHKFAPQELTVFDETLVAAGYDVTHWRNPAENWNDADTGKLSVDSYDYDVVFLNFHIVPHMDMGYTRLYGARAMNFWRGFYTSHPDVRCTSFGSPYLLFDQPHLPNMLLAYGGVEQSQKAAAEVWLGQRKAVGVSPVKHPEPRIIDSLEDI